MQAQDKKNVPGLLARLLMALFVPWKIIFDKAFAEEVEQLAGGEPASALPSGHAFIAHHLSEGDHEESTSKAAAPAEAEPSPKPDSGAVDPAPALRMLAALQRDGRLLDFLQEDIAAAPDADVGAAARIVHEGCRKTLAEYIDLEPVLKEEEGETVTVETGFDPGKVRLTGNVVGKPPYKGRLAHPGWRAARLELPKQTEELDPRVLAPAEVEI